MKLGAEKLKELIPGGQLDHRGKNVIGRCLKCNGDEFGISIEDNHRFGCFRKKQCGWTGNIFTLLKELGKLGEFLEEGQVYSRKEEKLINKLEVQESEVDLTLPTITQPIGWRRTFQHPYLESRNWTLQDYQHYKVGITAIDPKLRDMYVIFLIEELRELKGYVSRHIWSKERIKQENKKREEQGLGKILRYRNSDTDFSKLLGGYDELTPKTETVILVEGMFDRVGVNRLLNLNTQEEVKCLCTFKCAISLEQIFKLQRFKSIKDVILLYDPDVIDQVKKVALELEDKFQSIQIGFSETGHDPGEMELDELEQVLSRLYSVEEFLVRKLQKKLI